MITEMTTMIIMMITNDCCDDYHDYHGYTQFPPQGSTQDILVVLARINLRLSRFIQYVLWLTRKSLGTYQEISQSSQILFFLGSQEIFSLIQPGNIQEVWQELYGVRQVIPPIRQELSTFRKAAAPAYPVTRKVIELVPSI